MQSGTASRKVEKLAPSEVNDRVDNPPTPAVAPSMG